MSNITIEENICTYFDESFFFILIRAQKYKIKMSLGRTMSKLNKSKRVTML